MSDLCNICNGTLFEDIRFAGLETKIPCANPSCRQAFLARGSAAALVEIAAPEQTTFDFVAHLARQREWSCKTFGPGSRAEGVVDHIRKELKEIEADPGDLKEWVDVVILALDGAWRSGAQPQEIIDAIVSKQTKNEWRVWPDRRTADPTKAIEHDRSTEPAALLPLPRASEQAAPVAKVVEGFAGNRLMWLSRETQGATPVGTNLVPAALVPQLDGSSDAALIPSAWLKPGAVVPMTFENFGLLLKVARQMIVPAQQPPASAWVKTDQELPEEGVQVLGFWDTVAGVTVLNEKGIWVHPETIGEEYCDPYYWMPIAPPPHLEAAVEEKP